MRAEQWKSMTGIGFSRYEVSDLGRVRRLGTRTRSAGKPSPGWKNGKYRYVDLIDDLGHRQRPSVHVLVANLFIGPRPSGQVVRHLDGDDQNNAASNLEYGTRTDNYNDRMVTETLIDDEVRQEIARLRDAGLTQKEIAGAVGVSVATVSRTLSGDPARRSKRAALIEEVRTILEQPGDTVTLDRKLLQALLSAAGDANFE